MEERRRRTESLEMALTVGLRRVAIKTEVLQIAPRGTESRSNVILPEKIRNGGFGFGVECSGLGVSIRERESVLVGEPETTPIAEGWVGNANISGDLRDGLASSAILW
jgi:hypothetical protein